MRTTTGHEIPYLFFLRQLVMDKLAKHGTKSLKPGPHLIVRGAAGDSIRFDDHNHMIRATTQTRNCKGPGCKGCANFECIRCNVGLYSNGCFLVRQKRVIIFNQWEFRIVVNWPITGQDFEFWHFIHIWFRPVPRDNSSDCYNRILFWLQKVLNI